MSKRPTKKPKQVPPRSASLKAGKEPASASRHFKGMINLQPGKPIRIVETAQVARPAVARPELDAIAATLALYQKAARELLSGRYRELANVAPAHMRVPCDCWVVLCDDGIIVRWDKHEGEDRPKVRTAWPQDGPTTLEALVPNFSERFVYCPVDTSNFQFPPDGQKLLFAIGNAATGQQRPVMESPIGVLVNWEEAQKQLPLATNRPIPLASVVNELGLEILGEEFDAAAEPKPGTGQEFVLVARIRLPVGWEAFQLFPPFDLAIWRPDAAQVWAELDLLAASAQQNLRREQLNAIDPRAETRREYANRLMEFQSLLDGPEANVQQFLESNPSLLSPTYVQIWKKVALGKRVTDLIFREPPTEYTLVELEAPTRTLFRRDGQQHEDLTHAINQGLDWLRYIEDNLGTVQNELGLTGISSHPRCLIVIGRSAGLSDENKRKLATIQRESPRLRILTYDDLLITATQTISNLLGSISRTEGAVEIYYPWKPGARPNLFPTTG
jgi:hypothetical protein